MSILTLYFFTVSVFYRFLFIVFIALAKNTCHRPESTWRYPKGLFVEPHLFREKFEDIQISDYYYEWFRSRCISDKIISSDGCWPDFQLYTDFRMFVYIFLLTVETSDLTVHKNTPCFLHEALIPCQNKWCHRRLPPCTSLKYQRYYPQYRW